MAKNTSVSLGPHFEGFVHTRLETGRYGSASDVIRAGLRLLEEHESRYETLRRALIAGEKSGPSSPFDFEEFIATKKRD